MALMHDIRQAVWKLDREKVIDHFANEFPYDEEFEEHMPGATVPLSIPTIQDACESLGLSREAIIDVPAAVLEHGNANDKHISAVSLVDAALNDRSKETVAMVMQFIEASEHDGERNVRMSFELADTSRAGCLTQDIFHGALNTVGCVDATRNVVDELFLKYAENDDTLAYENFLALVHQRNDENPSPPNHSILSTAALALMRDLSKLVLTANEHGQDVYSTFEAFDEDSSGSLSANEVHNALTDLGMDEPGDGESRQVVSELVEHFSRRKGGMKYREFVALLLAGESVIDEYIKGQMRTPTPRPEQDEQSLDENEHESLVGLTSDPTPAERILLHIKALFSVAKDHDVDYRAPFERRDPGFTGLISAENFCDALEELGLRLREWQQQLIHELYLDLASRQLCYVDFLRVVRAKGDVVYDDHFELQQLRDQLSAEIFRAVRCGVQLKESFAHFDRDGDGYVSQQEFTIAIDKLGFTQFEPSIAARLIARFDTTTAGQGIDYAQFLRLVGQRDEQIMSYSNNSRSTSPSNADVHDEWFADSGNRINVQLGPQCFVAGVSDTAKYLSSKKKKMKKKRNRETKREHRQSQANNMKRYLEASRRLGLIRAGVIEREKTKQANELPEFVSVAVRQSRTSAGLIRQQVRESRRNGSDTRRYKTNDPKLQKSNSNSKLLRRKNGNQAQKKSNAPPPPQRHRIERHVLHRHERRSNGSNDDSERTWNKSVTYTGTLERPSESKLDIELAPTVGKVVQRIGYAADARNDYPTPSQSDLLHFRRNILTVNTSRNSGEQCHCDVTGRNEWEACSQCKQNPTDATASKNDLKISEEQDDDWLELRFGEKATALEELLRIRAEAHALSVRQRYEHLRHEICTSNSVKSLLELRVRAFQLVCLAFASELHLIQPVPTKYSTRNDGRSRSATSSKSTRTKTIKANKKSRNHQARRRPRGCDRERLDDPPWTSFLGRKCHKLKCNTYSTLFETKDACERSTEFLENKLPVGFPGKLEMAPKDVGLIVHVVVDLAEAFQHCGARLTAKAFAEHALAIVDHVRKKQVVSLKGLKLGVQSPRVEERLPGSRNSTTNSAIGSDDVEGFAEIYRLFHDLDHNGDGEIRIEELVKELVRDSDSNVVQRVAIMSPQSRTRLRNRAGDATSNNDPQDSPKRSRGRSATSFDVDAFMNAFAAMDQGLTGTITWPTFLNFFRANNLAFKDRVKALEASLKHKELAELRRMFTSLQQPHAPVGYVTLTDLLGLTRGDYVKLPRKLEENSGLSALATGNEGLQTKAFKKADVDKNGRLSWPEWIEFYCKFRPTDEHAVVRPRAMRVLAAVLFDFIHCPGVSMSKIDPSCNERLTAYISKLGRNWTYTSQAAHGAKKIRRRAKEQTVDDVVSVNDVQNVKNVAMLRRAKELVLGGLDEMERAVGDEHPSLILFHELLAKVYRAEALAAKMDAVVKGRLETDSLLCKSKGKQMVSSIIERLVRASGPESGKKNKNNNKKPLDRFKLETIARATIRAGRVRQAIKASAFNALSVKAIAFATKRVFVDQLNRASENSYQDLESARANLDLAALHLELKSQGSYALQALTKSLEFVNCETCSEFVCGLSRSAALLAHKLGVFLEAGDHFRNSARAAETVLAKKHTSLVSKQRSQRDMFDSASSCSSGDVEDSDDSWNEFDTIRMRESNINESTKKTKQHTSLHSNNSVPKHVQVVVELWEECASAYEQAGENETARRQACAACQRVVELVKPFVDSADDASAKLLMSACIRLGGAYVRECDLQAATEAFKGARRIAEVRYGERHPRVNAIDRLLNDARAKVKRRVVSRSSQATEKEKGKTDMREEELELDEDVVVDSTIDDALAMIAAMK